MAARKRLDIQLPLNGPQRAAHAALQPGNTLFLGWGRGVGKSKFVRLCCWMLGAAYHNRVRTNALAPFRGVRITVLMPTLKQFKDVHWAGLADELNGDWSWLGAKLDRQSGQINFSGGSWLKPFPATEYNARTALGLRTDVLVIDECDSVPATVYDQVAVPWLSEPWSLGIQIVSGTPNMGRHGLWWRTYQQGLLGAKIRNGETPDGLDEADRAALATIFPFRATYKDAPETVSAKAVAKAKATTLPATFKREWEADPDAGEGLVYPFEESFHVRAAPPETSFQEIHVGVDHGWVDAGVMLKVGIQGHGRDATAWVLDEWYQTETPNHVWNDRAAAWRSAKFWPDPSRPDRINDLRSLGLRIGDTDNNLHGGIARVADMLFRRKQEHGDDWARLFVSPNCKNTIREFGLYRRKKHSDGTFDDEPEDKNNHAMDALRYAIVGRFGRAPNVRQVVSGL